MYAQLILQFLIDCFELYIYVMVRTFTRALSIFLRLIFVFCFFFCHYSYLTLTLKERPINLIVKCFVHVLLHLVRHENC